MKKIMLLAVLLIAPACFAQNQQVNAALTAQDSGSCASANACLVLRLNANSGATIVQTSGTFSATYQFEGTADGANWVAVNGNPVGSTTAVQSATSPGAWQVNVAGMVAVRVRVSTYASGTVQAVITSSVASAAARGGSGGGGSGTVNPGLAHQPAFYPSSGTAVSGTCTVPVTNGQFPMMFNVTADAAVDPSCPQQGFVNTAITGAATSYAITSANNLQGIEHDVAGSQSVTYTLPTPTTLENPQFAIPQICNYSTHTDTLTPTTWTVNLVSSVTIPSNTCRSLSVDPFNANNWLAPTGGAPSGPAGGALGCTYPNPCFAAPQPLSPDVFYATTNCKGNATTCVQWTDDDSTNNCGAATTAWLALVNGYSGLGVPQVFIYESASGGAYKFSTCSLSFTNAIGVALHIYGNIDCAMALQSCIQIGATATSGGAVAYTTNQQSYHVDGGGYLLGGASLTGTGGNGSGTAGGIYVMPQTSGTIIQGINFGGTTTGHGFGATNATLGNCANWAIYFDYPLPSGTVEDSVAAIASTSSSVGACGFGNLNGVSTGSNTIYFSHNILYGNVGATTDCGSVGIADGGTLGAVEGNNIYAFGIPVEVLGVNHRTNQNQIDSAGCAAGGVNASIQYGGTGAVGPLIVTNNSVQLGSGHSTNMFNRKSGSSATLTGTTFAFNANNGPTITQAIMPATNCTPYLSTVASYGQFCNQNDNTGMIAAVPCGSTNTGWKIVTLIAACFPATATANIGSTALVTSMTGNPSVILTCEVVLTVAGSVTSTLPSCVIGYTDITTNTAQIATITPTWSTTGFPNNGCSSVSTNSTGASNTVGNRCSNTVTITPTNATAINYSTTGYASTNAGMTYQVFITANAQ